MCVDHYEKLKGTIHAFTSIAGRVTESQTRVKALKRSLVDCKGLLKCRREELKKLWMEGVECKQVLKLLDRMCNFCFGGLLDFLSRSVCLPVSLSVCLSMVVYFTHKHYCRLNKVALIAIFNLKVILISPIKSHYPYQSNVHK